MQSAARAQARLDDSLGLQLPQSAQSGRADGSAQQAFFDEHHGVRLVESVHRRKEGAHVAAVNLAKLRQYLFAQSDPGVAIAAIFRRLLLQHDVPSPFSPARRKLTPP